MPTRKWGAEKLVNTTTAGSQAFSDVAALAGGGFVVVWEDESAGSDAAIRAQRYDATGQTVGGEILIAGPIPTNDLDLPSVTGLADGGFYVTWTQNVGSGNNYIQGSVYNANGGFVRDQPVVFAFGEDDDSHVAKFGTGSIVAWTDPNFATGHNVLFRIFDAAGNGSPVLTANSFTPGFQQAPSVAASPDGSTAAIVWTGDGAIWGRLFDTAGAEKAPEFRVDLPGSFGAFDPLVAFLSNGVVAVAWRQLNSLDAASNEIKVRLFTANGPNALPLTGEIAVNSTIFGSQQDPTLTALPDGGFVVSWTDTSGVGVDGDSCIRLQAFDGAGGKIGGEMVVNTTTELSQVAPSVSALADGRVVVSWTDNSSGNNDIRMQIVDPRDGIVTGSGGQDTLYGHSLVNDEIGGGAGDDTLYGLGGNDGLYGGQGNDTLNGGTGGDEMYGGAGNDIYYVDNADDVVVEAAGQGADLVAVTLDYALTAGVSVETLRTTSNSGTNAIDLTGNALQQVIVGNAGQNILHDGGKGAADTLTGLGGNDTYRVFNSGDVIVEGASQGTADRVLAAVDYTLGTGVFVEILATNGSSGAAGLKLTGNEVAQAITGNAGDNRLEGKGGSDTLTGLLGDDTFVFATALGAGNIDAIADFNVADDRFLLSDAIFTALSAGTLASAAFLANTTGLAQDSSDRIIYETDTGKVFYDADGIGAIARIQFATIGAGLALANTDFSVA
ncbi:calcium-binding protein [Mesorhizobium sp. LHD-90]|uniref:calcium-binding protein n=1 Tax=Mesorhizobium sp. LHD-90 TaxID=3071414 RepID=UPI0027DF1BB6|nr:calcium-binding protein [Mesorhizobium sp. LHD-90]MDQ6432589.1 calcium-binding protein [Mesorhizobium sp. LHD-90]